LCSVGCCGLDAAIRTVRNRNRWLFGFCLTSYFRKMEKFKSIEICAGAGGQAIGLEEAGFEHLALVEIERLACQTLQANRPNWNVVQADVRNFDAREYRNQVDLLAGGVPCPPFSIAGKQLGQLDERDLFPEAIRIVRECDPKAVLLENVRGILDAKFHEYRGGIISELRLMGYEVAWRLLNSSDFGVSQLRPRAILVATKSEYFEFFHWPNKVQVKPPTVGDLLYHEMAKLGWERVNEWRLNANSIAPTLVGGSKKHGGADLGPTRAKRAWADLGVDGSGLADIPPVNGFNGMPKLTLQMTALVQGFPKDWEFIGKKTPAYRQIGNAFPAPVAKAVGLSIIKALRYGK
jgi:DNA (cytosine-5)-methyltransferase 1